MGAVFVGQRGGAGSERESALNGFPTGLPSGSRIRTGLCLTANSVSVAGHRTPPGKGIFRPETSGAWARYRERIWGQRPRCCGVAGRQPREITKVYEWWRQSRASRSLAFRSLESRKYREFSRFPGFKFLCESRKLSALQLVTPELTPKLTGNFKRGSGKPYRGTGTTYLQNRDR